MYFVKRFDSFFPVMILKTCIFKFSVLFGTHTLVYESLQLKTHLYNVTSNGA